MLDEANLAIELLQFAGDDFIHDVRGLAFDLLGVDFLFGLHGFGGNLVTCDAHRVDRGDVQREVGKQRLDGGIGQRSGFLEADFQQHAELAAQVDVADDRARALHLVSQVAAGNDVLADFRDLGFDLRLGGFGQRVVGHASGGREHFHHERLEVVVLGHEISFAVDFDHAAGLGIGRDFGGDNALLGGAGGFLGGNGHAGFAQQFDGRGFVAVGFHQCLFAFHHADAGFFA